MIMIMMMIGYFSIGLLTDSCLVGDMLLVIFLMSEKLKSLPPVD